MTFQQFTDAVKSAWGAVNNITIAVALLAAFGINTALPSAPGPIAVLACLLCYLIGFLVSCYKSNKNGEIAAKDAEIAKLADENLSLKKQLQIQEIPGAVTALQTVAAATSSSTEQVRTPNGKLCRNMTAVRQLPTETIEAMLDAFDHGGMCELAGHEKWVRSSIKSGDEVFYLDTMHFMGQSTGEETGRYWITKEWREFMDNAGVIAGMRDIVRSAGPVWHEI